MSRRNWCHRGHMSVGSSAVQEVMVRLRSGVNGNTAALLRAFAFLKTQEYRLYSLASQVYSTMTSLEVLHRLDES